MTSSKQVVVIAGSGNIAQYLAEEFTLDKTHHVVIISRSESGFFDKLGVSFEFLGNSRDFPNVPRGIQRARHSFREILANESEVKWTLLNQGWLADYFVQNPLGTKSHMRPFPEGWPIDMEAKTVRVVGTGNEPIGWTAARDLAKAVVKLVSSDDWDKHIYIYGELGTWNKAIEQVESFHSITLKRNYVTKEALDADLAGEEDERWYTATIDEWSLSGATAVPYEEAFQQRAKYFKDVHFRTISNLLRDSEHMKII
ncbi:hypothetical protein G7Z17_g11814 [Cylindrodendrum hubeiense]|uniref:Uncharacterized protein n=1 Tax=Cylindrodendrum hubeiense TaxID=595255 RepID=A0A9P5GZI2_9HYPO|nr:hypothetical protein G7Z17_g11814 [Cylindrodendrum hubeiense]